MSFSSHVKDELSKYVPRESHCLQAELSAFLLQFRDVLPEPGTLQRNCCKRTFLKGLFLAAGTIGDPEKIYQLEFSLASEQSAQFVLKQLAAFEIAGKVIERKGHYVVYLKDGNQIVDFLAVVQASASLLELENIRVVKDVRNSVNRQVNCETANLKKTVSAGVSQIRDIERISERIGIDKLPAPLREAAEVRLQNPDATLQELGELLDPPVGKSGMNHRFRRLHEIAEEEKL